MKFKIYTRRFAFVLLVSACFLVPRHAGLQELQIEAPRSPSQVFTVTTTSDTGAGSLRQAVIDANASPGLDAINFNIAGSSIQFVFVNSPLPTITDPVIVDGMTQPGYAGTPRIHLEGLGTGQAFNITAGSSSIKGLSFTSFFAGATNGIIRLSGNGSNVITGCNFGVRGDNTRPTTASIGVLIDGSNNNRVGGTTSAERNYFVIGSEQNLVIQNGASGNRVTGNWFGTGPNGVRMDSFGRDMIRILNSPNNTIGGSVATTPGGACAGECNVIAGAGNNGVFINGAAATGNRVIGNFVGLFAAGSTVNPNNLGIRVENAPNTTVGGTAAAERNVITGNTGLAGVLVTGAASTGTVITGNYIGLFSSGNAAPPTASATLDGILLNASSANTRVGGTTAGERNVISGLSNNGIEIAASNANTVIGNYIGTDASGMVRSTTGGNGILVAFSDNNSIGGIQGISRGGSCTGACNVISGNANNGTGNGIALNTANNNTIDGNYIGLNAAGTAPLLNGITPDGATHNGNAIIAVDSNSNTIGSLPSGLGMEADELSAARLESPTVTFCVQDDITGSYIRFDDKTGHYKAENCDTGQVKDSLADRTLPGVITFEGVSTTRFKTNGFDNFEASAIIGGRGIGEARGPGFAGMELESDFPNSINCSCPSKRGNAIGGRVLLGETGRSSNRNKIIGNKIGTNAAGTSSLDSLFTPTKSGIIADQANDTVIAHNVIHSVGDAIKINNGSIVTVTGGDFARPSGVGEPIRVLPSTGTLTTPVLTVITLEGENSILFQGRLVGAGGLRYRVEVFDVRAEILGKGLTEHYTGIEFIVSIPNGQTSVDFEKKFTGVDYYDLASLDKKAVTITEITEIIEVLRPSDDQQPTVDVLRRTSQISAAVSAPTIPVTISGRVTTPAGLGLRNAVVTITDSLGVRQTATTSSFGVYSFNNIRGRETYVIGVSSKRYRFATRTLEVNTNLTGVDFIGLE